jgi:AcrR family transcriptional regulator
MIDAVAGRPVRRRGAALVQALLSAAWEELSRNGYGRFTMEAVADRAQTSRAVLYRRWPDRWDLALAAVRHHSEQNPVLVTDTGSLRGDLIAYLADASAKRSDLALFGLRMAQVFDDSRTSPAQLREQLLEGRTVGTDLIYERAAARGEVDLDALTPRAKTLAFDLLRAELMMTLQPVPEPVIAELVDQIVLPVVTNRPPPAPAAEPERPAGRRSR